MRVLLTGATGFVGSWTVPALLARGHEVRALVRDEAKAAAVLERRGVDLARIDLAVGDMLDEDAVTAAVVGCDAVLHTAAAIGVTSGGAVSVRDQNVLGARTVIGAGLAAGCDPVVHVSTVAVFIPAEGPFVTADSRLASPRNEYGRSKVETEHELRARQAGGAPITIVYPGGVFGPDQPHLDAGIEGILGARTGGWPVTAGGVSIIDVRDLAEILAAVVEPGQGPRRLLAGGRFTTWAELGALLDDLTGVRTRRIRFPVPLLLGTGRVLDLVRRVRPVGYPLTRDAAEIMVRMVPTDDRPTLAATGVELRPLAETMADTLRWALEAGHLAPRYAPALA
jgi:nucleoside-diphosphate-sugar epimerase